ncbi:MAG: hypothetical protein R3A12_08620 [Ignavibacteria bacterium]
MDVGNVWSKVDKVKLNQFALASGFGLRYYSIVGAIRIDLGFKHMILSRVQSGVQTGSSVRMQLQ